MYELFVLTKRNILTFIRDKTAVFFSLFSVLILLALYTLFLKNSYASGIEGIFTDKNKVDFFTNSIVISGILVMNTVTLALGNLGNVVNDFENKIIDSFLVTPVKRFKVIFSYYLSSLIITYVLSIILWIVAVIVVGISTQIWYSFGTFVFISLILLVYTFISTGIMIFIITFINSTNAFGAISGVFGTLIGFMSGIYMPLSILPKAIQNFSSLLPFTHMTSLVKSYLLKPGFNLIEGENKELIIDGLKDGYGIGNIEIFGAQIHIAIILIVSCLISLGLLIISTIRISKKISK